MDKPTPNNSELEPLPLLSATAATLRELGKTGIADELMKSDDEFLVSAGDRIRRYGAVGVMAAVAIGAMALTAKKLNNRGEVLEASVNDLTLAISGEDEVQYNWKQNVQRTLKKLPTSMVSHNGKRSDKSLYTLGDVKPQQSSPMRKRKRKTPAKQVKINKKPPNEAAPDTPKPHKGVPAKRIVPSHLR